MANGFPDKVPACKRAEQDIHYFCIDAKESLANHHQLLFRNK
jgi:hypothetical protein